MNYKKQSQFELFPGAASGASIPRTKLTDLFKNLTLSLEHIIVLAIIFLMVLVLTFSMGVERGRQALATPEVSAPRVQQIKTVSPAAVRSPQALQTKTVDNSRTVIREEPQPTLTPKTMPAGTLPAQIKKDSTEKNRQILEIPLEKEKFLEQLYTIQVASFKSQESAQREADHLKEKGFESLIVRKGEHLIVCVGKFLEKEAAQKLLNKLRGKYNDSLVRRL